VATCSAVVQNEVVMSSMSPQTNRSEVLKVISAFYLGYAREKVKRPFILSNFSTGNIILCREQHVSALQNERV